MSKLKGLLLLSLGFLFGSFLPLITSVVLAHGGNANFIHGCIRNNGLLAGFVRIVGANTNCANNETALDWNALGSPGTGSFVVDLQGAQLNNADLRYRSFKDANLSNASLELTQLAGANLTNTNLSNTILRSASFEDNNLTTTNFSNANLTMVSMRNVNLSNKDLTNVVFTNPNNNVGFTISNSNLSGTNFSQIDITSPDAANFTGSNLTNANLASFKADKGSGHAQGALFINTTLTQTNFTNASIKEADFSNANGSQTNFTNANLQGSIGFNSAILTTPIWSNTTCPDGTNSNNNSDTCEGHLTP